MVINVKQFVPDQCIRHENICIVLPDTCTKQLKQKGNTLNRSEKTALICTFMCFKQMQIFYLREKEGVGI